MAVTYDFTKVTGGATIISTDGADNISVSSSIVMKLKKSTSTIVFQFAGAGGNTLELTLPQIGKVNGTPYADTLANLPATLLSTVFPKATSGGSVSPGAWYLRGDATTLNSVRINIVGTSVKIEEYDGSAWYEVTTLATPV